MFNTLLESRALRARRTGGSFVSIAVHTTVVATLLVVTANATTAKPPVEPVEKLHFTHVDVPKPVLPPSADQVYRNTPVAKGFQVLVPPIEIPTVLPTIDPTAAQTIAEDFIARGVPGGRANGVDGGVAMPTPTNGVYTEVQVEKPVVLAPGATGPAYPELLRAAGIDGSVLAQFVVDTTGRADVTSFTALRSDNALFTAAVRAALGRMRFLPAEVGGRKVAQLVQQSFQFSVNPPAAPRRP